MKYLLFIVPLLLSSCTSIRYVTTEKGHLITDRHEPVNIVGNPAMTCHYEDSDEYYCGYFMYQNDDGTIVLDNFGEGTISFSGNPICTLGFDPRGMND